MEIRCAGSQPSGKGPSDLFTGTVRIRWLDMADEIENSILPGFGEGSSNDSAMNAS